MEPKDCPFCGSENVLMDLSHYKHDLYTVFCHDCGAMGPPLKPRREAIRLWNNTHRNTGVITDLVIALKEAVGGETSTECDFDHHGYCQAHGSHSDGPCWVKTAEEAIAKAESLLSNL